jgi:murein DD-endopeptidase MepM/ murein hydrolase activator NlpD
MGLKKMTVILVPEGKETVKQFRIPRITILFGVLLVLCTAAFMTLLLRDYRHAKSRMPLLARLKVENEHQKTQLGYLAKRIEGLAQKVTELKEFDHRLKVMVAMDNEKAEEGTGGGQGGSEPSSLRPDFSSTRTQRDLVRLMHRSLDQMDSELLSGEKQKAELHRFLEDQKVFLASTPSIWPAKGWLSSRFGYRQSPFTGQKEFHKGVDISARMNAPIIAPASGIITYVGKEGGYGRMVRINHGHGVVTRFAHIEKALVKKGQRVKRGETIALVGNTGRSTGPHVHYEVHLNGVPVNPLRYILE